MAANTHFHEPAATWPPPASLDPENENAVADWAYAASLEDARRRIEIAAHGKFLFKVRRGAARQKAFNNNKIKFSKQFCSVAKNYVDKTGNTDLLTRKRALSIPELPTCKISSRSVTATFIHGSRHDNAYTTESFSAKRKRLQSCIHATIVQHKADRVHFSVVTAPFQPSSHASSTFNMHVNSITGSGNHNDTTGAISLPLSRVTTEGRPPFCATKQTKDNKSPSTCILSSNHSATSAAIFNSQNHNNIFNFPHIVLLPPIFLPSSNSGGLSPLEEPGAFSITTHSTNTLHNQDRGGSRNLSQADHVGPTSLPTLVHT